MVIVFLTNKMFNEKYLKDNQLTKAQALQFELMKLSSFNGFNAKEVMKSLLLHRDWWEACFMTRDILTETIFHWPPKIKHASGDLITLRDIESNYWNVDTLYIIANRGKERKMEKLSKTWRPDSVGFLSKKDAETRLGSWPFNKRVLGVWWD